jgi:DNA-binding response OmpR family regulator
MASSAGNVEQARNTILVVEDNPRAAKLLSIYLIGAGYGVLIAQNGREALRLAAQHQPMAITLDLVLPDVDGWQVLSELKSMPETRDIPVVIVSVLDREVLGFRLGACDYLVKPVDRAELLYALRRYIHREGENRVRRKVIVVHTNPDELNLLAMMLAREDYQVIQALGTEEAANLAKYAHPDLVVANLVTGGIDLHGLLERLKATPETAHIPVLALTTVAPSSAEQVREEGWIEFVLLQENEFIDERLLAAITMLFARTNLPSGND